MNSPGNLSTTIKSSLPQKEKRKVQLAREGVDSMTTLGHETTQST